MKIRTIQQNKICLICSKKFIPKNSQIKRGGGKFCSSDCYFKSLKGKEPWNKGKKGLQKMSEDTKRKMSLAGKGRIFSEEHRKKLSISITGRVLSEETKRKIGLKSSLKTMSDENRIKLSKMYKGEKSHWWKGGITKEIRRLRNCLEYKLWREAIFKRDDYTCIWCNKRGVTLNADHIKPFAYFPELRFAIDNGRTLCVDCHKTTDTYANKAKTKDYTAE